MKLKKFLGFFIAAAVTVLGLSFQACAEDYYRIDMSEYGYNFSVEMPSSYTIDTAIDNDELMDKGVFWDAYEMQDKSIPGMCINVGVEFPQLASMDLRTATDDELDAFCTMMFDNVERDYGLYIDSASQNSCKKR